MTLSLAPGLHPVLCLRTWSSRGISRQCYLSCEGDWVVGRPRTVSFLLSDAEMAMLMRQWHDTEVSMGMMTSPGFPQAVKMQPIVRVSLFVHTSSLPWTVFPGAQVPVVKTLSRLDLATEAKQMDPQCPSSWDSASIMLSSETPQVNLNNIYCVPVMCRAKSWNAWHFTILLRSATMLAAFADFGKLCCLAISSAGWPFIIFYICKLDYNPGDESLCMIEESLKTVFNNALLYNE